LDLSAKRGKWKDGGKRRKSKRDNEPVNKEEQKTNAKKNTVTKQNEIKREKKQGKIPKIRKAEKEKKEIETQGECEQQQSHKWPQRE
jgi:hypothetical protein